MRSSVLVRMYGHGSSGLRGCGGTVWEGNEAGEDDQRARINMGKERAVVDKQTDGALNRCLMVQGLVGVNDIASPRA